MAALLKTLVFVGAVLLLGGGIFYRWIGPELLTPAMKWRLRRGVIVGLSLLILASLADVAWTPSRILGRFDLAFIWEYLLYSHQGRATLVRILLAVLTALMVFGSSLPLRVDNIVFALLGLGVLATFSYLSHAASMGGLLPLIADLGHFSAAALWAGSVIYLAWSPAWWQQEKSHSLLLAVRRVSKTGLLSVLLLFITGIYASLLHIASPTILATSPYGRILVIKVSLVLTILGLAALNRWSFLPALEAAKDQQSFGRMINVEAWFLLVVLTVTGVLTTTPPPHG